MHHVFGVLVIPGKFERLLDTDVLVILGGILSICLGYFLFAEVPVIWTWIGAAIIVGSALYIARREAFASGP